MDSSILQNLPYLLATVVVGGLIGWLLRGFDSKRRLDQLYDKLQTKLDDVSRQRDRYCAETNTLRSTIESQQAATYGHEQEVANTRT